MAGRDLDFYMGTEGAWDALSDEDKATLFNGGALEGETAKPEPEAPVTTAAESSETPAAATEQEPKAEEGKTEGQGAPTDEMAADKDEPVVLTKDGKHTIPFSELESAREHGKRLEQIVKEQSELISQMKAPKSDPSPPPTNESEATKEAASLDLAALEKQALEAMVEGDVDKALQIRTQINAEVHRLAVESVRSSIAQESAAGEAERAFAAAVSKAVTDYPFLDSASGAKNEAAIAEVVEWRDFNLSKGMTPADALVKAVERIGPLYAPKPQPAAEVAAPATDVAKKAAELIAAAKPKAPTSLSEVPAGTAAPHDEAAAIREMSGVGLMQKFAGKTPDQIMELMNRVI